MGQVVHVSDDESDWRECYSWVGMCKSTGNSFHDAFSFRRIFRYITCESIKDIDYSPLITVVHCSQQFLDGWLFKIKLWLSFEFTANRNCNERVWNNSSVSVVEKIVEQFEKPFFFDEIGWNLVHFWYTKSSCLTHIWVFILQSLFERITQVLHDIFDTDAPHGPDGKCPEKRVGLVGCVLNSDKSTFLKALTPRMARSGWDLA